MSRRDERRTSCSTCRPSSSIPSRFEFSDLKPRPGCGRPAAIRLSSFVPEELVEAVRTCGFPVLRDVSLEAIRDRNLAGHIDWMKLGRLALLIWAGAEAYGA